MDNVVVCRQFRIGFSRRLLLALHGLHGLALIACWANTLPWQGQALFSIGVSLSWRLQIRCYQAKVTYLRLDANGWSLANSAGEWQPIEIVGSSVLTPWLLLLHLQGESATEILVMPDSLVADDFRRLLVLVKINNG